MSSKMITDIVENNKHCRGKEKVEKGENRCK